jgi:hypothetical protein
MRNVSGKSCTETQNTHFRFNKFFSEIMPFKRQCGKIHTAGQATDGNVAHALCMLNA